MQVLDDDTRETYVGLTAHDAVSLVDTDNVVAYPGLSTTVLMQENLSKGKKVEELHFVSYYYRANRGGKEHMRVGLRRWRR